MARKKYPARSISLRSSPDRSAGDSPSSRSDEASMTKKWISDVTDVLERPSIALALFFLGVIFIVLASKQVKKCLDLLESFGVVARPRDGILNNFMAVFVFLFVWCDIIMVTKLSKYSMDVCKKCGFTP